MVNTSNLRIGGGVQKAVQFFLACCSFGNGHQWRFILSPQVAASLDLNKIPAWMSLVESEYSSARIVEGRATRRLLKSEEKGFQPDVVFSVSGPCYHLFKQPHLMGFAVGWITHPSDLAWACLKSSRAKVKFYLRLKYYALWARFADEWLLQTETAAQGLAKVFRLDQSRFHVVPNSCSDYYFLEREKSNVWPSKQNNETKDSYRLLVISSYKAHKNLDIVPEIAAILDQRQFPQKFQFVFTIEEDSAPWQAMAAKARHFGVEDCLSTVGSVLVSKGPGLYASCNAVFLPTVLETFSATYPEAMCMELPIITSDLDFAQDICRDAARYFDPVDPESAAIAIEEVANDVGLRRELVSNGMRRLGDFGTSEDRFQAVVKILERMALKRQMDS